jgi:hypothetical protein
VGDPYVIAYGLEGLAIQACKYGDMERAARLWGACDKMRRGQPAATPFERRLYEQARRDVATALGETQFRESLQLGEAMSTQEAIAYALDESG